MDFRKFSIIDCFFSGGRDSALACYTAFLTARAIKKPFRLVFVNTRNYVPDTWNYVHEYASWLGAELKVVDSPNDYFELVKVYGYPNVRTNRWCVNKLKQEASFKLIVEEIKEGHEPLWVFGIRAGESGIRRARYGKLARNFVRGLIKGMPVYQWFPVLFVENHEVEGLLQRFGIPRNPVWDKVGISGDCLCLAGTGRLTLEALFLHYPDVAKRFYEFDKSIQPMSRSKEALRPPALLGKGMRLHEFIERLWQNPPKSPPKVSYSSCPVSCMVSL